MRMVVFLVVWGQWIGSRPVPAADARGSGGLPVRLLRSGSLVRVESDMAGSRAVERGARPNYMRE